MSGIPSHWAGTSTPIASQIVGKRSTFSVNSVDDRPVGLGVTRVAHDADDVVARLEQAHPCRSAPDRRAARRGRR